MRIFLPLLTLTVFLAFCNTTKVDKKELVKPDSIQVVDVDEMVDNNDTIESIIDTSFIINGYRLTFKKADSVFIPELYDDAKERQIFNDSNDNWHQRARQIENYLSEKGGKYFKRLDSSLLVYLDNGSHITLTDSPIEDEWFNYESYLSSINSYLIRVQWSEGNNYLLVNKSTGAKKYIIGQAYPSFSGMRILSINEDVFAGFSNNGLEYLINEKDSLISKFIIETGDSAPIKVKWLSETEVILKVISYPFDDPNNFKMSYYKMKIDQLK